METWEWIVLAVAIVAVLALAAAFVRIRQRRTHLKERFGPEYQRAVADHGVGASRVAALATSRPSERVSVCATCRPRPAIAISTSGDRPRFDSSAIRAMRPAPQSGSSFALSTSADTPRGR